MTENLAFYISDIGRLMRKRYDVAARDVGVTGAQWRLIFNVYRNPGINQGQLAERMEVEPITTCRMVDRLEQAGMVERRRDPQDRRVWRIYLTDSALPLIERLKTIGQGIIDQSMAVLSEAERETLAGLLDRVRSGLLVDAAVQTREKSNG